MIRNEKPFVSIIVPVYNAEKWLRRCMDSLVYQTLENIEVIAVNNGSTDSSLSILKEYSCRFPGKVFVFSIPHADRAGTGRNYGINKARADFINFCDADDFFDFKAMEIMYKKANECNCDIVYAPFYIVRDKPRIIGKLVEPVTVPDILLNGNAAFWNKLIHISLFKKAGKIPEDISFEDCAYFPVLASFAKKVGYVNHPFYYYIIREDSEVNSYMSLRMLDEIEAIKWHIQKSNKAYLEYIIAGAAKKIVNAINLRWIFSDSYIRYLKELRPYLKNNEFILKDKKLSAAVRTYLRIPDEPIPCNIYINGFGRTYDENYLDELGSKAFYNECKIFILDENNCDYRENTIIKKAYELEKFDFVANYFALKKIFENGGIYLDKRIVIEAPFNNIRYTRAFFSYIDTSNYSDCVFGAMKGNEVIASILNTYDEFGLCDDPFSPLSARIKNILTVKYSIPLNGRTNRYKYPVSVFSPDVMVCQTNISNKKKLHICSHDFSDYSQSDEIVTLKKSTLQTIATLSDMGNSGIRNESVDRLKNHISNLENRIYYLENSSSWKITRPLRILAHKMKGNKNKLIWKLAWPLQRLIKGLICNIVK